MLSKWLEVSIAGEEGEAFVDAMRCKQHVYGFSNRDAASTELTVSKSRIIVVLD